MDVSRAKPERRTECHTHGLAGCLVRAAKNCVTPMQMRQIFKTVRLGLAAVAVSGYRRKCHRAAIYLCDLER